MIKDVKSFMENVEKINGVHIDSMNKIGLDQSHQNGFLSDVRAMFDSKLDTFDGEPIDLYKFILSRAWYEVQKKYRNFVSSHNKKVLARRGNLCWDSSKGMYRKATNEAKK